MVLPQSCRVGARQLAVRLTSCTKCSLLLLINLLRSQAKQRFVAVRTESSVFNKQIYPKLQVMRGGDLIST
ncbi:hypothetical protein EDC04DRAFT_2705933 [Pisolithus marmoratus]|nr:hypothetical protein EDC04DRAFT_2705933 [Pisolithus marmoratus]